MHKEILSSTQIELLPFIKEIKRNFYLVGGTAMSLQIGHRRSIDFDLFKSAETLNLKAIKASYKKIRTKEKRIIYESFDQIHFQVKDVKITFFAYPYKIKADISFETICRMPDLLTLSAMKVFALGGRAKWKDYVDLYFILKYHYSLEQISKKAIEIFEDSFSPKLLRQQLAYFDDIDYSEEVEFIRHEVSKDEIKSFLIDIAVERF